MLIYNGTDIIISDTDDILNEKFFRNLSVKQVSMIKISNCDNFISFDPSWLKVSKYDDQGYFLGKFEPSIIIENCHNFTTLTNKNKSVIFLTIRDCSLFSYLNDDVLNSLQSCNLEKVPINNFKIGSIILSLSLIDLPELIELPSFDKYQTVLDRYHIENLYQRLTLFIPDSCTNIKVIRCPNINMIFDKVYDTVKVNHCYLESLDNIIDFDKARISHADFSHNKLKDITLKSGWYYNLNLSFNNIDNIDFEHVKIDKNLEKVNVEKVKIDQDSTINDKMAMQKLLGINLVLPKKFEKIKNVNVKIDQDSSTINDKMVMQKLLGVNLVLPQLKKKQSLKSEESKDFKDSSDFRPFNAIKSKIILNDIKTVINLSHNYLTTINYSSELDNCKLLDLTYNLIYNTNIEKMLPHCQILTDKLPVDFGCYGQYDNKDVKTNVLPSVNKLKQLSKDDLYQQLNVNDFIINRAYGPFAYISHNDLLNQVYDKIHNNSKCYLVGQDFDHLDLLNRHDDNNDYSNISVSIDNHIYNLSNIDERTLIKYKNNLRKLLQPFVDHYVYKINNCEVLLDIYLNLKY